MKPEQRIVELTKQVNRMGDQLRQAAKDLETIAKERDRLEAKLADAMIAAREVEP